MPQVTARERLEECVSGLDCVEQWVEEVRKEFSSQGKVEGKLVDSLDYVREIRRRLKALLNDPFYLPDLASGVAVSYQCSDDRHEESDGIC